MSRHRFGTLTALRLTLLCLFFFIGLSGSASAAVLARFEEGGLRITLFDDSQDGRTAYRLEIAEQHGGGEFDLGADVFVLQDPVRLVADVPGFAAKRSAVKSLSHPDFSAIRIGRHPDKTRIVIDFRTAKLPNYHPSLSTDGKKFTVEIGYFGEPVTARNAQEAPPEDLSKSPALTEPSAERPEHEEPLFDEPVYHETTVATTTTTTLRLTTTTTTTLPTTTLPRRTTTTTVPTVEPAEPLDLPITKEKLNELMEEGGGPQEALAPRTPAGTGTGLDLDNLGITEQPQPVRPPADIEPQQPQPFESSGLTGSSLGTQTSPASGVSKVTGIYFKADAGLTAQESTVKEGAKANSSVMVSVDSLKDYSLSKDKPNVYQLVIPKAQLGGEHLTLPQFPPDGLVGFEVIAAAQDGENVVIKLYVEDNVKLSPFRINDQIWLSASQ